MPSRKLTPFIFLLLPLAYLFLLPSVSYALCGKQCREAKRFCQDYEKAHPNEECGRVRGAICTGKSWKKIKQVNVAWSACRLVRGQEDNKKALQRCKEFKKNWGGQCIVSSPLCKVGWVALAKHGKFRACRPIEVTSNMRYNAYKAFMRKFEGKAKHKMHSRLRAFANKKYLFDANKIRWGYASNTPSTCITDCMNIYCNNKNIVEQIKSGKVINDIVFHELAHSEQCIKKGGRKNYAKLWFNNLPKGFFGALNPKVKDKFKDKIHDRMPMEKQAEKKAISLDKKGWWTKKARCRVYKFDKKTIVYTSNSAHHRYFCDPKYDNKLKKHAQAYAKNRNSATYWLAFGKPHINQGVWLEKGKFGKKIKRGIGGMKKKE